MSVSTPEVVTIGSVARLTADLTDFVGAPEDASAITWLVRTPAGDEQDRSADVQHDEQGVYHLDLTVDAIGDWYWRVATAGFVAAAEGWITGASIYEPRSTDPSDVRVMVPRVRRAVEGVVRAKWTLSDDEVKDLVADAIADVILYTGESSGTFGTIFGVRLDPTAWDANNAPTEYRTSAPFGLEVQTVVASQAALNYFFHRFSALKVSETIADEASHWSWNLSPNLLVAQLKLLQDQRDKALDAVLIEEGVRDEYISFLADRDTITARIVEPWVWGHPEGYGIGAGGLEGDFRFDMLPSGGGDYRGVP